MTPVEVGMGRLEGGWVLVRDVWTPSLRKGPTGPIYTMSRTSDGNFSSAPPGPSVKRGLLKNGVAHM